MEEMINKALLRKLRKEHSWSQDQLALISGLSHRTIQQIENEGGCSLESKKSIAIALNINSSELDSVVEFKTKSSPNVSWHCRNIRANHKRGVVFAYSGAILGLIGSYSGITFSVLNGYIGYGEAGFYYGFTGAVCGLFCGVMGALSNRQPE